MVIEDLIIQKKTRRIKDFMFVYLFVTWTTAQLRLFAISIEIFHAERDEKKFVVIDFYRRISRIKLLLPLY